MSHGVIDITRQRFGRLLVLHEVIQRPKGGAWWVCLCDCGEVRPIRAKGLRKGTTRSCGCLRREVAAGLRARTSRSAQVCG